MSDAPDKSADPLYYDPAAMKDRDETALDRSVRRRREIGDFRKVLETPEGRRLLWRVVSETGVYNESFVPDSNITAFKEGKRNIGLLLIAEINIANPTKFAQMQSDYLSELNARKEPK